MRLAIWALAALAASTATHQRVYGGTQTGTITDFIVRDSDGLIYLQLSGTPTGRPTCAAGTPYWIIPNETTDTGKRLYSALLGARMAGRSVIIVGKNTCTRLSTGEDIEAVNV